MSDEKTMENLDDKKEIIKQDNAFISFLKEIREMVKIIVSCYEDSFDSTFRDMNLFDPFDDILGVSDVEYGNLFLDQERLLDIEKKLLQIYSTIFVDSELSSLRSRSFVINAVDDLCIDSNMVNSASNREFLRTDNNLNKQINKFGLIIALNKYYNQNGVAGILDLNDEIIKYQASLKQIENRLIKGDLDSMSRLNDFQKILFINGIISWIDMRDNKLSGGLLNMTESEVRRRINVLSSLLESKKF